MSLVMLPSGNFPTRAASRIRLIFRRNRSSARPSEAAYSYDATLNKTTRLRELLTNKDLSFLMEAHNGLSAKVVEEAGFKGIWASGASISAAFGVLQRRRGRRC